MLQHLLVAVAGVLLLLPPARCLERFMVPYNHEPL